MGRGRMAGKLRRKLGDDGEHPVYIFTEPRVGFRMPKGTGNSRSGIPRDSVNAEGTLP